MHYPRGRAPDHAPRTCWWPSLEQRLHQKASGAHTVLGCVTRLSVIVLRFRRPQPPRHSLDVFIVKSEDALRGRAPGRTGQHKMERVCHRGRGLRTDRIASPERQASMGGPANGAAPTRGSAASMAGGPRAVCGGALDKRKRRASHLSPGASLYLGSEGSRRKHSSVWRRITSSAARNHVRS